MYKTKNKEKKNETNKVKVGTWVSFWPSVNMTERNFNPSTRHERLTRLDNRFHVNALKHLTAKGLPFAVIQPGLKSNPEACKEAPKERFLRSNGVILSLQMFTVASLK